jgi:hypothetical protein
MSNGSAEKAPAKAEGDGWVCLCIEAECGKERAGKSACVTGAFAESTLKL